MIKAALACSVPYCNHGAITGQIKASSNEVTLHSYYCWKYATAGPNSDLRVKYDYHFCCFCFMIFYDHYY